VKLAPSPGEVVSRENPEDERVRAEQIVLIYQQAPLAVLITLVVAALIGVMLWELTDRWRLLTWLSLTLIVATARMTLVLRWRRRPESRRLESWERLFVASLAATGLAWGGGAVLVMPPQSLVHQAVVYFFLIGMAGGAVVSYAAHARSANVTIWTLMLPPTAWFLLQGDALRSGMALGGVCYVLVAYRAVGILTFFLRRSLQLSHELAAAREAAEALARTDVLTGMRNRRAFYELSELALEQAKRYSQPLSLLLLDLDRFKAINDAHGHAAGDAALQATAGVLRAASRATDVAARLGGEEFGVLLPQTCAADAQRLAERIRSGIAALRVAHQDAVLAFSCSIGVAERALPAETLDALVARADRGLYQAKHQGRDRVVVAPPGSGQVERRLG
jgi:diguanylate cyclase (GGDEF)-like protein